MIAGTPGRPRAEEDGRKYQVIPVLAAAVRSVTNTVHGQVIRYDWQDEAWYPQPDSGALCGVQRLVTAGRRNRARITCATCLRKAERYWTDYENYLAPGEERKGR